MKAAQRIRDAVMTKARALGAFVEVERTGSVVSILVDAPNGQHWSDGNVHSLRIEGRPTTNADMDELWSDALMRMRVGLEACDTACQEAIDAKEEGGE